MAGKKGFGVLLKKGSGGGGSETFTTVAGVTSIGLPGTSTDIIDVTDMSSPGGFEEVVGGIKRTSSISVGLNLDPANAAHAALLDNSGNLDNWQIVFPFTPALTWQFAAVQESIEASAPYDGKIEATLTLKVSGQVDRDGV